MLGSDANKYANGEYSYNYHSRSVKLEKLTNDQGIADFWDMSAKATDPTTGEEFVYSVEAKKYPIMGT